MMLKVAGEWRFAAVPLLLTPMLGKFAPKGVTICTAAMLVPPSRTPNPERTTVFPFPWTSQATPRRGANMSQAGLPLVRNRRARPELLDRRGVQRIYIGIEIADVVTFLHWRSVVLVSSTQVQGESGVDAPVILSKNSVPVSPGVLCTIAQKNRRSARDALEEILQRGEAGRPLSPAIGVSLKNIVQIFKAIFEGVLTV